MVIKLEQEQEQRLELVMVDFVVVKVQAILIFEVKTLVLK